MSHRQTLCVLPNGAACVEMIDKLHALFLAEHKRAPTIQLFASVTSNEHSITLYADDFAAQAGEIEWFKLMTTPVLRQQTLSL